MTSIAIVGPGAVAGVLAWHLARAGLAPTLVARPATADRISAEGLTLLGGGVDAGFPVAATSEPAALGPQDLVFVGFKAHDWIAGLGTVLPLIGPRTLVVPMLNGVPWWFFQGAGGAHDGRVVEASDPGGRLAASVPVRQIAGCVVYFAASRETPARIRWSGRKRLIIGSPIRSADPRISGLVAMLKQAGLDASESADIRADVWAKLLGNVTHNPLSVVTGATTGRMYGHPPFRRIQRMIMEETVMLGRALGVIGEVDIDQRLRVAPEMQDFKTSMLQDYEAGRPLELAAIVDAVTELGALANVPMPMTEAIGALAAERSRLQRMERE
jgi:2-dehydropantoate 2-reductase